MLGRRTPDIRRENRQDWAPREIFDLLDTFWRDSFAPSLLGDGKQGLEFPAVNVSEDENNINVKAELPGMEAKDVDICLQENNLILRGEKKFEDEENKENYYRIERSYGQFYRNIPLSAQIDENNVKAKMNNGVLEITLPKKEPATGTKKIEIES